MAGAAQQDWGFTEITRKFERQSKPSRRRRQAPRRRWTPAPARSAMHAGVWVGVIALLLMGLVGLRVSLLYKNIQYNDLIAQKNTLQVQNDSLSRDVSALSSPQRIEQIAEGKLGMVSTDKVQYVYIDPPDGQQYADLSQAGRPDGRTASH